MAGARCWSRWLPATEGREALYFRAMPIPVTIRSFVRGGRLKQSGHSHCGALAEQDSELGLGHGPLARRHHPLLFGAVQHREEEFCGGVIIWEMPPGSIARRSLAFKASLAFVVYKIRRTSPGEERNDLGPGPGASPPQRQSVRFRRRRASTAR